MQHAVGADERHPDRRVVEGAAEALLGVGQLPLLALEVEEGGDLRAEDLRLERLLDVVERPDGVAALDLVQLAVDRGHEEDGRLRVARGLPDARGGLEAVEAGHLDVEQDEREVLLAEPLERLLARARPHEALAERLEDRFEGDQVRRAVVHQEDAGARSVSHRVH